MTTPTEALKLAQTALEGVRSAWGNIPGLMSPGGLKAQIDRAAYLVSAALAQAEQQDHFPDAGKMVQAEQPAEQAQQVAPDCLSMDDDGDVSIDFRAGDDMLTMSVSKTGRLAYAWRTPEATNEPRGSGEVRVHVAVHEVLRAALAAPPAAQPLTALLQPVCRYISDVLASDAGPIEKHIARTAMLLLPLDAAIAAQPLTDEQIDAGVEAWFTTDITINGGKDRGHPFRQRMRAAIERAHGIGTPAQMGSQAPNDEAKRPAASGSV